MLFDRMITTLHKSLKTNMDNLTKTQKVNIWNIHTEDNQDHKQKKLRKKKNIGRKSDIQVQLEYRQCRLQRKSNQF